MPEEFHYGGCQCGAVRFKTAATPARVIACHCKTCKQRTGSAFGIGVYFEQQHVEILQGQLHSFKFYSSESGRWLNNEFCPKCASSVTWTLEMRPGIRGVAGGNFDDPHWFKIGAHIWTGSARADICYPEGTDVHSGALPPG